MRSLTYRCRRVIESTGYALQAFAQRRKWDYLAVHKRPLTKLPPSLALPLLSGHVKGKLTCPPNLTILLIHNYEEEPIMERSLRYVGIEDFVALKSKSTDCWFNAIKLLELKKFLDSGQCKTEYIVFFDSDDVVLRDRPEKAIEYLIEEDCDMLLSSTGFQGGYECMPQVKRWTDRIARENGYHQLYINSGVYVARTTFLREVVASAVQYVTDENLSREEYRELRRKRQLCERLPSFPEGVGSDQVILRWLHPRFYPRMKIDYRGRLALRY